MPRAVAPWLRLLLALLPAAAVGCAEPRAEPHHEVETYVALGDSFTSGAGLPATVPTSACQRSDLAYPRRVAEALGARLDDVSCGGATTENATMPQPRGTGSAPPQLDAVRSGTDLVTVGLGYNDSRFYLDLVFGCTAIAAATPQGQPCQDQRTEEGASDPVTVAADIGTKVRAVLEAVRQRAPSAKVLLVGYPQLLPEDGPCAALPLAAGDHQFVRSAFERLDDALDRAAQDAGATFVDVYAASDGHDVCAGDDAWINGVDPRPGAAAPYHPLEEGQRAVADLVLEALDD